MSISAKEIRKYGSGLNLFATAGCAIKADDIVHILGLEYTVDIERHPAGGCGPVRVLTKEGACDLADIMASCCDRDALLALADRFECGSALYMTGAEVAGAIRGAVGV